MSHREIIALIVSHREIIALIVSHREIIALIVSHRESRCHTQDRDCMHDNLISVTQRAPW